MAEPTTKYELVVPKTLRDRLMAYSVKSGLLRSAIIKAAIDDYLRARDH